MPRRATFAALGIVALLAAFLWIPWATEKRVVVASTPVPPALFSVTPIPLGPGQSACMNQVTLDPNSQIVEIGVDTGGKPGPPLDVAATGRGYRATTRVPGGYTDTNGPALQFGLEPPRRALLARLCIRNSGERSLKLDGTNEFRTSGRPSLEIDGAPQEVDARLLIYARERTSYASRIGDIFDHASTFTPGFLGAPVLIVLGLLALLGIPAATFAALAAAAREDDETADS
jgi:hypothetical protein